jgi:hypothetical protein
MKAFFIVSLIASFIVSFSIKAQCIPEVGLYRTFEKSLENNATHLNKFTDVDLKCTYISPSGHLSYFTWCGHEGESPLMAHGPQVLPFSNAENGYTESACQIDILSNIMNNEVSFYTMSPADSLLTDTDQHNV